MLIFNVSLGRLRRESSEKGYGEVNKSMPHYSEQKQRNSKNQTTSTVLKLK